MMNHALVTKDENKDYPLICIGYDPVVRPRSHFQQGNREPPTHK
jgi:hypothetical protein